MIYNTIWPNSDYKLEIQAVDLNSIKKNKFIANIRTYHYHVMSKFTFLSDTYVRISVAFQPQ